MELFERLAYYGQQIVFMVYLRDVLGYSESQAGGFSSIFGGVMWLFPIVAGTLADKWGFRRAFMIAFTILALGYFLIGSLGMKAFAGFYGNRAALLPSPPLSDLHRHRRVVHQAVGSRHGRRDELGRKPVASASRSITGWSTRARWPARPSRTLSAIVSATSLSICVSAFSCVAMLVVTLTKYKDVKPASGEVVETLGKKFVNLVVVLRNFRFIIFLLIYALYWIIFWQEYIIIPYYVTDYIGKSAAYELVTSWAGAGAIVAFQIPLNRLTKNLPTHKAILAGFAISSFIWVIIGISPSLPTIAAGIVAFAIGEMIQAPDIMSIFRRLRPPGNRLSSRGMHSFQSPSRVSSEIRCSAGCTRRQRLQGIWESYGCP